MVLGWTQQQIAADLGLSQAAVSKMLKRLELRHLRQLAETVDRQKARHTLRLEFTYREAIRAWEASQHDTTRRRQRKTQSGATVAELVVENQSGDPRFLAVALKALTDLRTLWGLDAPQTLDVPAVPNPYLTMSEEALRQAIAERADLLGLAHPAVIDTAPTAALDGARASSPGAETDHS